MYVQSTWQSWWVSALFFFSCGWNVQCWMQFRIHLYSCNCFWCTPASICWASICHISSGGRFCSRVRRSNPLIFCNFFVKHLIKYSTCSLPTYLTQSCWQQGCNIFKFLFVYCQNRLVVKARDWLVKDCSCPVVTHEETQIVAVKGCVGIYIWDWYKLNRVFVCKLAKAKHIC